MTPDFFDTPRGQNLLMIVALLTIVIGCFRCSG